MDQKDIQLAGFGGNSMMVKQLTWAVLLLPCSSSHPDLVQPLVESVDADQQLNNSKTSSSFQTEI